MTRSLLAAVVTTAACGNPQPSVSTNPPTDPVVVDQPPSCSGGTNNVGSGPTVGVAPAGVPAGFGSAFSPQVGVTHTATDAPPALSGGTMKVLKDGHTVVAADPDRDQIYVVDLTKRQVTATIPLTKGDEPGRVVTDAAGRAHVALRHGGALVTIDPVAGAVTARREVCAAPRGLAYDAAHDLVHVACADGELVSLPSAGGDATRRLQLDRDLRDVVVDGPRLQVTRFRSAELLTVADDGTVSDRVAPPPFFSLNVRGGALYTPSVAWRALSMPTGGVAILHQRGLNEEVQPIAGGYGGFSPCDAIVQTAVTVVAPGQSPQTGPAMAGLVLSVDMDISADGQKVAMISAGNATNSETAGGTPRLPRVFVTDMNAATDDVIGCSNDGMHGPCLATGVFMGAASGGSTGFVGETGFAGQTGASGGDTGTTETGSGGATGTDNIPPSPPSTTIIPTSCDPTGTGTTNDPNPVPQVVGEPIAIAFAANNAVVVQSREPAVLSFAGGPPITLSTTSRSDTGHSLFHANAGGFIACASCHAEGNDDARVWRFTCEGERRTQSMQVGLRGTEPFHWGGDEMNFPQLVSDVFVGRMSGPQLQPDQVDATLHWIDAQPRLARTAPTMTDSVLRGQALFSDPKGAACSTCHNGPSLTNNQTVDVGTGGKFQVPSLVGIGTRGPYMHNGCAATLKDRFGACGGGDKHGLTSKLSSTQVDDLVAYLNTL
ncbi:MAG TPA: cytochrome-c peroxidase [Polyangia bacterium]|nr:cytochrome-c peroxidase [Polyangia bacterium]